MKILVVVHGFPPASEGGSEIYAEAHARALQREHGDDVLVLTREHDPGAPEYRVRRESRDGLSIVWINNTFRSTRTFEETYRNPGVGAIAERVIDEFAPDVAHIHHLTCLSTTIVESLAARRIPTSFTLHDYWLLCHRGQLLDLSLRVCEGPEPSGCHECLGSQAGTPASSFMVAPAIRAIERRLPETPARYLRQIAAGAAALASSPAGAAREAGKRFEHMRGVSAGVTHFLAPSGYLRDRFVRFGIAADHITKIDLGLDHAPFLGMTRTTSPRLRIGFLGTLMVSKAPDVLLDAFRHLPAGSATVDLIGAYSSYHGDDSYRARLEPLMKMDGVRAHGAVTHARVVDTLASIDVLVVPSIWPENSPLVIREAFLAGIPVVASRIGGIPEAVEDGRNGLLFRPGDAQDLSRVLTRLIEEPQLLDTLRAGIPAVRTIEDDVRETRLLYQAHLNRSATSSPSVRPPVTTASPLSHAPRLAAVVLHYRTPDDTFLAVKSLLSSRRPIDEIIVVDNDTVADARARARVQDDRVRYVHTGANLGFSGGMNVGIRTALEGGAARVLLLNSDVIVPPDCVALLGQSLDTTDRAGIAGPAILARSDPTSIESLGISYTPRTGRMRNLGFGTRAAASERLPTGTVDAVSGCVMLIARDVFDSIGVFDEDYFFSFEDLDFCLKARRAGFSTVVAGAARVYHEGGRSIGAQSPDRLYYAARNHLLMAQRAESTSRAASFVRAMSIVAQNLAHAVASPGGLAPARVGAVLSGTRDYIAGRFGSAESAGR